MASLIFKEASAALRRTPIMAVVTSIVIAVSLAICAIFAMITKRADDALTEFRNKLIIEAFFDPAISSDEAMERANAVIKNFSGVTFVQSISKENALSDYQRNSGEDVEQILGYNPLPASTRLKFSDLTSAKAKLVKAQLLKIEGMKEVLYDEKTLLSLENRSQTLSLLAMTIAGFLLVISFAVVISTIRLAVESRRDTMNAMKLLGAGRMTILMPYVLEGSVAGLLGGILCGGLILLSHFFVKELAPDLSLMLAGNKQYLVAFGSPIAIGMIIGMTGSFLAVWRSSKT